MLSARHSYGCTPLSLGVNNLNVSQMIGVAGQETTLEPRHEIIESLLRPTDPTINY
jgi:hypothetical protein